MAEFEKFVEPPCDCRAVIARLVARESKDGRGRPAPGSIAVCDCGKRWVLVNSLDGGWWQELKPAVEANTFTQRLSRWFNDF